MKQPSLIHPQLSTEIRISDWLEGYRLAMQHDDDGIVLIRKQLDGIKNTIDSMEHDVGVMSCHFTRMQGVSQLSTMIVYLRLTR